MTRLRGQNLLVVGMLVAAVVLVAPIAATGTCLTVPGDVNQDGGADIADVQCTLLVVLWQLAGGAESAPGCLIGDGDSADGDCDGVYAVTDVQLAITYALSLPLSPVVDGDANGCPDTCDPQVAPCVDPGAPLPAGGCQLPDMPVQQGALQLVPAFVGLPDFVQPLFLTHAGDGSNRLFLIEQVGRIRVFDNDPAVVDAGVFLDLTNKMAVTYGEGGLLGLAFHPDYEVNGEFFVSYVRQGVTSLESVISRFHVSADPNVADAASEEILLVVSQPYNNHNGGWIGFGPDGYFYAVFGDGGSACGITGDSQDPTTLRGSVLRIDVDSTTGGLPYGIPADNPWADGVGAAPETFAYGLRNPWRMSFDTQTGLLWAGDVGQGANEEIDVIVPGGNYGWPVREGTICQPATGGCAGLVPACEDGNFVEPVAEYDHIVGRSVTAGYVYRGTEFPSLQGAFVYGDFVTQAVWVWHYGLEPAPYAPTLVAPEPISSFGVDEDQELYVVGYFGHIYRFAQADASTLPPDFPTSLSATGCFSDVAALRPAPGVVPYASKAELWSDGALKRRWVSIPAGSTVAFNATDTWGFPAGTTLIKHFEMEATEGDPSSAIRLETRLVAVDADGVRGYTYRWNDEGTEAYLLAGADTRTFELQRAGEAPFDYTWHFPSRGQCLACHTPATGGVLGLTSHQLNHEFDYASEKACGAEAAGGSVANQLSAWSAWGLFDAPPADPAALGSYVDPSDESASDRDRARSFLHTNCSHCHRPGSSTGSNLDFRGTTPVGGMNAVWQPAKSGSAGVVLNLIEAGDPGVSELVVRLHSGPPQRMPPMGTQLLPVGEVAAVESWIANLEAELPCPPSGFSANPTNYGPPWGVGEDGVAYYHRASVGNLFALFKGVDTATHDMWLAIRWTGSARSPDEVGGRSFVADVQGGWTKALRIHGPGSLCLHDASGPGICAPIGLDHYSGGAGFPNTSVRLPWAALGLTGAPSAYEIVAWTTDEAVTEVRSAVPTPAPLGPAPQPAGPWQPFGAPTCTQ